MFWCYLVARSVDSAHCQHVICLLASEAWQQAAYQVSNKLENHCPSQGRDSFWTDAIQRAASALSCLRGHQAAHVQACCKQAPAHLSFVWLCDHQTVMITAWPSDCGSRSMALRERASPCFGQAEWPEQVCPAHVAGEAGGLCITWSCIHCNTRTTLPIDLCKCRWECIATLLSAACLGECHAGAQEVDIWQDANRFIASSSLVKPASND